MHSAKQAYQAFWKPRQLPKMYEGKWSEKKEIKEKGAWVQLKLLSALPRDAHFVWTKEESKLQKLISYKFIT
jgi:hypothetical protein